ncbi:sulfurtransferase [Streptomyces sp. NPDC002640]
MRGMNSALVTAAELAGLLDGPTPPVLLDVRWQLSVAKANGEPGFDGRAEYERGHLPGAAYVDLDRELAGPPGEGGRHPLPDLGVLAAALRRAGVSAGRPVVAYDGGIGWGAARAWWLLRWAGHRDVRVLDGGLPAWRGPLAEGPGPAPEEGDFVPEPGGMPVVDAAGAAELARGGLLLDARAGERYRGEVEPVDPVGGHIPGAVSAPTSLNTGPDGRFRPLGELAAHYAELGAAKEGARVGVYCGSGVSAAQEVLALELVGIRAALYPGSWSEWVTDPSRPVARG